MDDKTTAMASSAYDVEKIKEMIPHRHPFLMIEKVENVIPDVSAIGIKTLDPGESFFEGHFPGHPIMPGVLIIEAMAQTSAVLVIATTGKQPGSMIYFMSVDHARFRKPAFPGDCLYLYIEKQRRRGDVWKFKGEAKVNDILVAEAIFSAMIVEPK